MFLRPTRFSYFRGPLLVFGECKTFGDFEERDFQRARDLARLFPGAMLCFGTLKEALNHSEKKEIAKIARKGRTHLKNGQQSNPVLVLTRVELFGQFKLGGFLRMVRSPTRHALSMCFQHGSHKSFATLRNRFILAWSRIIPGLNRRGGNDWRSSRSRRCENRVSSVFRSIPVKLDCSP